MIVPNVSKFRLYEFCALKLDVFHCLSLTIQTLVLCLWTRIKNSNCHTVYQFKKNKNKASVCSIYTPTLGLSAQHVVIPFLQIDGCLAVAAVA